MSQQRLNKEPEDSKIGGSRISKPQEFILPVPETLHIIYYDVSSSQPTARPPCLNHEASSSDASISRENNADLSFYLGLQLAILTIYSVLTDGGLARNL